MVLLRPSTERLNHLTAWLNLFLESDLDYVLHVLQFSFEAFEFIIAVGYSLLNEWKTRNSTYLVPSVLWNQFIFLWMSDLELLSQFLRKQLKVFPVLNALL